MIELPAGILHWYDDFLERKAIAIDLRPNYRKWLRYYWDYCHKNGFDPADKQRFSGFNRKLESKNQPEAIRRQAHQAIVLYH